MGPETPLAGDVDVLADANIFYAIGHPSNPKYGRFRDTVQQAGVVLKLPRRVVGELGGPETDRVETALEAGWAEIVDAPSLTESDAVAASDIARQTIASVTGQPEHEVEKADTILAGLAIQYLRDRSQTGVVVLTDDKPARRGIENAVQAQGDTEKITVCGLADIIGDEPGDSIRLI